MDATAFKIPLDSLHPSSPGYLKRSTGSGKTSEAEKSEAGKSEAGKTSEAAKGDSALDLLSKFVVGPDTTPELKHCFDRLHALACSPEVKRTAWTILDRAQRKGCPIKDVVIRGIDNEDVNLYWKELHHECDVIEADGVVYVRVNIRTCDEKTGWKSHVVEMEGTIDKQCSGAASRLTSALARKSSRY